MHIPDGFMNASTSLGAGAVAAGGLGVSLRRTARTLQEKQAPLAGLVAAFIFAVQMLNFPVAGGTSGHFLGAALAAILLGPWVACLVMSVVLVTQSFVFADGGVTALGANILNMGVIGALLVGGLMLAAQRVLPNRRGVLLAVIGVGSWLAVVHAGRALGRLNVPGRIMTALPAVSAVLIVGVGVVLTVQAVPQLA